MTLDEAIQHAEEVAENKYGLADAYHTDEGVYLEEETECRMCAEEHAQLAAWLKELKAYRAQEQNRFKEIKKEVKARSYYINYHNGCVETGLSTKDILGIIDKYA